MDGHAEGLQQVRSDLQHVQLHNGNSDEDILRCKSRMGSARKEVSNTRRRKKLSKVNLNGIVHLRWIANQLHKIKNHLNQPHTRSEVFNLYIFSCPIIKKILYNNVCLVHSSM